jgi:hypothetical protein
VGKKPRKFAGGKCQQLIHTNSPFDQTAPRTVSGMASYLRGNNNQLNIKNQCTCCQVLVKKSYQTCQNQIPLETADAIEDYP